MRSMLLFAQMPGLETLRPENVIAYILMTLAFLFVLWLVDHRTRPLGSTFVLWGILVVILSCGYGLIGIPTLVTITPTLSKIGFLMVLGGMAWTFLVPPSSPKESDHV